VLSVLENRWLPEIIWREVMTNVLSLMGTAPLAASQISGSGASVAPLELVWRNTGSSQLAWQRLGNGQRMTAVGDAVDPSWKIIGTGDVNRDRRLDVLWRHDSGAVGWWIMGENNQRQEAPALPSVPDLNWQVMGMGDANNDGHLDILWRNVVTGMNQWWLMSSYQAGSGQHRPLGAMAVLTVDSSWQVGGVADQNRDGIADIFWYHRPSGTNQWWLMQADGTPRSAVFLNQAIPVGQSVRGIADYNGDGQMDFILQDAVGNATAWLMRPSANVSNQVDVIERASLSVGLSGSGWQLFGIANINNREASPMQSDAGNSLAGATLLSNSVFTVSQLIGGVGDPFDNYSFKVDQRGIFTASLSGLSADADLKLILDTNTNRQLDAGDDVLWQWERGNQAESVRRLLEPGSYFLEVSSYDGNPTDYTVQTGLQPLGPNEVDPLKFDIQINYGVGSDRLNAASRNAIEAAALFWERAIPYRTNERLILNGALPITIDTKDENLKDGKPDVLTLATGGPDVVSSGTRLRLRGGKVTLNGRRLDGLTTGDLTALLIHEFAHVLGFGTLWSPLNFRASDGSIVPIGTLPNGASFIDRTSQQYMADSYAGWAYGDLLKQAGRTTTTIPTAVPLDAQGFHWAEDIFQNESLTPVAPNSGQLAPVSQLTLAGLKDLGWAVNFGIAQSYSLAAPRPVSAADDIDFSNFSYTTAQSVAPEASSVACGCQYHLASSGSGLMMVGRDSLAAAVGIA
jgi:hypothetical protein